MMYLVRLGSSDLANNARALLKVILVVAEVTRNWENDPKIGQLAVYFSHCMTRVRVKQTEFHYLGE